MIDTTSDDAVLALRVRSGDRDALGELYDRHASVALGVALRVVGDRQLAEDIVHDAFVIAWQKIGGFDATRGGVRGWLLTIVRNRAIDRVRATRPSVAVDDAKDSAFQTGPDPTWDAAIDRMSGARLRAALDLLPEEQRTAVELAYFGGRTYREVADMTGVPAGTAASRMRLALGQLRSILANTDADALREPGMIRQVGR